MTDKPPYCSFCGKSGDEVRKLVAGPTVLICNECVDLCKEICDGETISKEVPPDISSDDYVRPGFEHGLTKAVVVEKVKRRLVDDESRLDKIERRIERLEQKLTDKQP